MRKLLIYLAFLQTPCLAYSQFGIKAGLNFANVSNASSINSSSRSGFNIGVLMGAGGKSIVSSRSELIFSRQGYDYTTGTNSGNVNLDYIQFGQLMAVNITKYFSVMGGLHTAYLLNAKVDSTQNGNTNGNAPGIMSMFNRFDYGLGLAAEVHPFKGILVGARYNISLNKLYESVQTGQRPSFSSEDAKNNVVQVYLGYRIGK